MVKFLAAILGRTETHREHSFGGVVRHCDALPAIASMCPESDRAQGFSVWNHDIAPSARTDPPSLCSAGPEPRQPLGVLALRMLEA